MEDKGMMSEFPIEHFVGREAELDILQRELVGSSARTVWISGPRGVGKTSLAMMFGTLKKDAFPGGVFNLNASPLESLENTVARSVARDSNRSLIIINDAEVRPRDRIAQEIAILQHLYANARMVITSSAIPTNKAGVDLQVNLKGLPRAKFQKLLKMLLVSTSISHAISGNLYAAFAGLPLAVELFTDLIREGGVSPRELIKRLQPFTSPGIVGTRGEPLSEDTPQHGHVISDVVTVSDAFLRKLHENPRMLYELSSRGFEELVAELLGRLGYEINLTPPCKDGGKDIYAAKKDHLGSFLYVVECKKYAPDHPVGVGLVRQLNGVVQAEQATAGILATTSFFTKGAKEFQKMISFQISLKDYLGIQDWLTTVLKGEETEQPNSADAKRLRR